MVFLKGDSGTRLVLLGSDCSSAVQLSPGETIALSYVSEKAFASGGSKLAAQALLPETAQKGEMTTTSAKLQYGTNVGRVSISIENTQGETVVTKSDGTVMYNEKFDSSAL